MLADDDVGKPRGQASVRRLAQLSVSTGLEALTGERRAPGVTVALKPSADCAVAFARAGPLTADVLRRFSVVVATRGSHAALVALDAQCRSVGVPFVAASARGLCASVFCDFGAPRADKGVPHCAR